MIWQFLQMSDQLDLTRIRNHLQGGFFVQIRTLWIIRKRTITREKQYWSPAPNRNVTGVNEIVQNHTY